MIILFIDDVFLLFGVIALPIVGFIDLILLILIAISMQIEVCL
jgi:hypothetical protein